jgi:hypothetical protein
MHSASLVYMDLDEVIHLPAKRQTRTCNAPRNQLSYLVYLFAENGKSSS